MAVLSVRIPDKIEVEIRNEARAKGVSVSSYCKSIIENRERNLETEKPQNIAGNMASNTDILSIKKTMDGSFDSR